MKYFVPCIQCPAEPKRFYPVVLNDEFIFDLTCVEGHSSSFLLRNMRFEALFDVGAHAILDGYYREAIVDFQASVERFYEFFVRVVALKSNVPTGAMNTTWKEVAVQSEHQLGAYLISYLLTYQEKAPSISQDLVTLRNRVIHNGRIPTRAEAVDYGDAVLAVISPTLKRMRLDMWEEFDAELRRNEEEIRAKAAERRPYTATGSILNLSLGSTYPTDLEAELRRIKDTRTKFAQFFQPEQS